MAGAQDALVHPQIRRIGRADIADALGLGIDDFLVKPSHYVFLCIIYPLVGVVLAYWTSGAGALPLLFPLMSGFALIGPFAAIGLYEISRRRELGMDTSWWHAFSLRHSPAVPSIAAMGIMLLGVFVAWLLAARGLYVWLFGPEAPASIGSFLDEVFTTGHGWALIILGNLIGLAFALVVLCTTVIAFPMLIDRDCGAVSAIETSARAVLANPGTMILWGLIVAAALVIGSIPLFAGLAIVVPVLGHATWHLYRKVVAPA
jgi:uncharacterized membrane protein